MENLVITICEVHRQKRNLLCLLRHASSEQAAPAPKDTAPHAFDNRCALEPPIALLTHTIRASSSPDSANFAAYRRSHYPSLLLCPTHYFSQTWQQEKHKNITLRADKSATVRVLPRGLQLSRSRPAASLLLQNPKWLLSRQLNPT